MLEVEDVEQRQRRLRMFSAFLVAPLHFVCLQNIFLKDWTEKALLQKSTQTFPLILACAGPLP